MAYRGCGLPIKEPTAKARANWAHVLGAMARTAGQEGLKEMLKPRTDSAVVSDYLKVLREAQEFDEAKALHEEKVTSRKALTTQGVFSNIGVQNGLDDADVGGDEAVGSGDDEDESETSSEDEGSGEDEAYLGEDDASSEGRSSDDDDDPDDAISSPDVEDQPSSDHERALDGDNGGRLFEENERSRHPPERRYLPLMESEESRLRNQALQDKRRAPFFPHDDTPADVQRLYREWWENRSRWARR